MCKGRIRYNWVNVSHLQDTAIHRKNLMDVIQNLREISPTAVESISDKPHRFRKLSMCPPHTTNPNTHQLWKNIQSRHVFVDKLEEVGGTPHILPPDIILNRLKTVRHKLLEVPQNDTPQLEQVDWWGQHIQRKSRLVHIKFKYRRIFPRIRTNMGLRTH
jgi:hypothetical protein